MNESKVTGLRYFLVPSDFPFDLSYHKTTLCDGGIYSMTYRSQIHVVPIAK